MRYVIADVLNLFVWGAIIKYPIELEIVIDIIKLYNSMFFTVYIQNSIIEAVPNILIVGFIILYWKITFFFFYYVNVPQYFPD